MKEENDECDEKDPRLHAVLDEAVAYSNAHPGQGYTADEVRAMVKKWTRGPTSTG